MAFLKIEDLCKVYGKNENKVTALDHVSLTIEKGSLLQSLVLLVLVNLHYYIPLQE